MMKAALKECDSKVLKNIIKNEFGKESFYDILIQSINDYMSFDYLDLLYDNGMKVHDILPVDYMADLMKTFAHNMRMVSRATNTFSNMEGITDEEINDFYTFKIARREDTKYIGYYLAMKTMIEKEELTNHEYNVMMKRFIGYMYDSNKHFDVFEQIINLVKDKLDYNECCDAMHYLSKYTVYYGSEGLKNFMLEKGKTNSNFKKYIEAHTADLERWKERQNKQKSKVTVEITEPVTVTVNTNPFNYHEFINNLDLEHPF
jgi:hypothetical protein